MRNKLLAKYDKIFDLSENTDKEAIILSFRHEK
jgi:hypothetical protein